MIISEKDAKQIIIEIVADSTSVKQKLIEQQSDVILDISKAITDTLSKGGTVYLFGNGGSAADGTGYKLAKSNRQDSRELKLVFVYLFY